MKSIWSFFPSIVRNNYFFQYQRTDIWNWNRSFKIGIDIFLVEKWEKNDVEFSCIILPSNIVLIVVNRLRTGLSTSKISPSADFNFSFCSDMFSILIFKCEEISSSWLFYRDPHPQEKKATSFDDSFIFSRWIIFCHYKLWWKKPQSIVAIWIQMKKKRRSQGVSFSRSRRVQLERRKKMMKRFCSSSTKVHYRSDPSFSPSEKKKKVH